MTGETKGLDGFFSDTKIDHTYSTRNKDLRPEVSLHGFKSNAVRLFNHVSINYTNVLGKMPKTIVKDFPYWNSN